MTQIDQTDSSETNNNEGILLIAMHPNIGGYFKGSQHCLSLLMKLSPCKRLIVINGIVIFAITLEEY